MSKANIKANSKNALQVDSSVNCGCTKACAGLIPTFDWTLDSGADTLTVVPSSTIPSGDSVSTNTVYVRQSSVDDWVTDIAAPFVIDLTQFDNQKPLQVRLRVVTADGCIDYVDTIIAAGWGQGNAAGEGNWETYPPN